MAAVTQAIVNADTTNGSSYTSGSFTPATDDLIVVFVYATGTAASAPTCTDTEGTAFTLVDRCRVGASTDYVYVFVANALSTSNARDITVSGLTSATGAVVEVMRVSGMKRTGAAAVVQTAKNENQAGGAAPTTTFAATPGSSNPVVAMVGNSTNPLSLGAPSLFTNQLNTGYATPTSGAQAVSRNSGAGAATTFTTNSATTWGLLTVELDTRVYDVAPPSGSFTTPAADYQSVSGSSVALTVAATDADSGVASVAFKDPAGATISTDTTSPYTATWNSTTVNDGQVTLTALITDNVGLTATVSRVVTVENRVDVAAPSVRIRSY